MRPPRWVERRNLFPTPSARSTQSSWTLIRRLGPGSPQAFNERSRLRISDPWPNDPAGRTPEEIVGGAGTLDLVIEFVDNLYNAIVIDSIGTASATFSTDVAVGDWLLISRAIAQELAIANTGPERTKRLGCPLKAYRQVSQRNSHCSKCGSMRRQPLRRARPPASCRTCGRTRQTQSPLSLKPGARGGAGRARSPFWKGLDQIAAAENAAAARKALDAHLACVASLLGGQGDAGVVGKWGVQLFLTGSGAVGPALAAALWQFPGMSRISHDSPRAVAPVITQKAAQSARHWREHGGGPTHSEESST